MEIPPDVVFIADLSRALDATRSTSQPSAGSKTSCTLQKHREKWNHRRVTVFGQTGSGATSVSKMLAGHRTQLKHNLRSPFFCPLSLCALFSASSREQGVVISVKGIGHQPERGAPDREILKKNSFRPWSKEFYEFVPQNSSPTEWGTLFLDASMRLRDIDENFAIQLGLLLSSTIVYVTTKQTMEETFLDDSIANLEDKIFKAKCVCKEGSDLLREPKRVYILVNSCDNVEQVKQFTAKSEYKWLFLDRKRHVGFDFYQRQTPRRFPKEKTTEKPLVDSIVLVALLEEKEKGGSEVTHNQAVLSYVYSSDCDFQSSSLPASETVVEKAACYIVHDYVETKSQKTQVKFRKKDTKTKSSNEELYSLTICDSPEDCRRDPSCVYILGENDKSGGVSWGKCPENENVIIKMKLEDQRVVKTPVVQTIRALSSGSFTTFVISLVSLNSSKLLVPVRKTIQFEERVKYCQESFEEKVSQNDQYLFFAFTKCCDYDDDEHDV